MLSLNVKPMLSADLVSGIREVVNRIHTDLSLMPLVCFTVASIKEWMEYLGEVIEKADYNSRPFI